MSSDAAPTLDCAGISEEEIPALILKAQQGDAEAFSELAESIETRLNRHALFLCGDEHQARDLMQETMIEAWKHVARYDQRARFFTWVCSIMAHRHYDWVRRFRRRLKVLTGLAEEAPTHAEARIDPGNECAILVRETLELLPAKQRMVIYLRFYAGESLEGIAGLERCSIGTVKSRLFHGLERLSKMKQLQELRADWPPNS